ncbi:MAG: hypothetical protein DRO40_02375 [Thermoprotei archaeon]|nr:MAG: hypothetical protein DRO40_02375 [Thermoprotei archaeon]
MLLAKEDFRIIDKYLFLNQTRFRIQVRGTNIVFNVQADNEDEALEKAVDLARETGLSREIIDKIRERIKAGHQ